LDVEDPQQVEVVGIESKLSLQVAGVLFWVTSTAWTIVNRV